MVRIKVFFSIFFFVFMTVSGKVPDGNSFVFSENSSLFNVNEFYLPTVNSESGICKNHSINYLEELRRLKWWATLMYDSGGRPASGQLYGAAYKMGNFDECLEVTAPPQYDTFRGQYCMGKFTLQQKIIDPRSSDIENRYNESIWHRIAKLTQDRTKAARNELYLAYCIPSSCSYQDLKQALERYLEEQNINQDNFKIKFEISQKNCQTQQTINFDIGDILFVAFIVFTILVVILASLYDTVSLKNYPKVPKFEGKCHKAILCFSFPRNYKKLVTKSSNTDGFDCISGMKVYSMVLIVSLHRIMFVLGNPILNPKHVEEWYSRFESAVLLNGPILTETFFTISGFLATYFILAQLNKSKNGLHLISFYIHRVVRMSPTYAVVLAFYCTLLVKIGSGPLWQEKVGLERERCRASWWTNLLYINNYVNTDKICMFQSWFMTCDMNFFLFTPVICWILWKKPKIGMIITLATLLTSILIVFVIVYVNNLDAIYMLYIKVLKDPVSDDWFKILYIPGHTRASSYFVGIFTGYLKYSMKENGSKISGKIVKIGWTLCVLLMVGSLFTGYVFFVFEVPPIFSALYSSLFHLLWGIGIAWMLIAFSSGHGVWVEPILTWRPLGVLSRLTYSLYVSHGIIQMYTSCSVRSPQYVSIPGIAYQSASDLLLAFLLAFVLSMLYETPLICLEKVLLRRSTTGDKSADTVKVDEIESSIELK